MLIAVVALAAALAMAVLLNRARLPALRQSMDAGAKCVGTAGSQCREPGWVWRGHRLAAGFCSGAGLGAGDRGQPVGLTRGGDQRARRADRLGLRRIDRSPRRTRP